MSSKAKKTTNSNAQQSKRKNRRKRNRKTGQDRLPMNNGLSHCAADYAAALANPFTGPLACIPDYPVLMTRKVRSFAKGVVSTGTAGFGFVAITPQNGVANDLRFCGFTDAAFTGTAPTMTTGNVTGINYSSSNAEYVAATFGSGLNQYRVVSCGLRIRYVGTELDRGGQLVGYHDPQHFSIMASPGVGRTVSSLDGEVESRRFPVDRSWKTVLYRPVDDVDNQLDPGTRFMGPVLDVDADGVWYMTFYILAASAATSLTYEWEAYATYEISGRNVRGKTVSHFDPPGFASVHAASVQTQLLLPSQLNDGERVTSFLREAGSYLNTAISGVRGFISDVTPVVSGVSSMIAEML